MNKASLNFLLKSARIYFLHKLRKDVPFLITINPTEKCNLKCSYCLKWKSKKIDTIRSKRLFSLINEIKKIGTPLLSISGGEPLLFKDTLKFGKEAKKKGIYVNLNTNGTLINKSNYKELSENFNVIRISLDGVRNLHDKMSGVRGTYDKVINSIDLIRKSKNRNAKIGINFVVTDSNAHQIEKAAKLFQKKVDFISFLPKFNFKQSGKYSISVPKDFKIAHSNLQKINKSGNTKTFIDKVNLNFSKRICQAGKLFISIMADGSVFACPFVSKENNLNSYLGNIYEESLEKIVNKKKIKYSRNCFGCYATCTTEVSRIFNMSAFELIKHFMSLKRTYKV